jgi:DNA-binding MarR family transcriptional regulator
MTVRTDTGAPEADSTCISPVHDERITLMGLLMESKDLLSRVHYADLNESCGLPLSWYDVMIRLGRSPDGHLTMTRLAGEVSFTSGGITRLVDRMVTAGYVERVSCPTDRRSVFVSLTPAGSRMLETATAEHLRGLERHLIAPLDPTDRAALATALAKLRGDGPICGR